jgi:DnaJ-class molecular chaperone
VRRGAADGDVISFPRASEQRPGRIPGDVTLKLKVQSHVDVRVSGARGFVTTKLKRRGRDLHAEVGITLREALLGFERTIEHVDGHEVVVSRSGRVTPPGATLRVAGEGLAKADEDGIIDEAATGALVLTVRVDFPSEISEEAARWAQQVLPA